MITLNPFVENNKAKINAFLNQLCEVGDFYETLEVRSHGDHSPGTRQVLTHMSADGSVYGPIEEGLDDPHYAQ